MIKARRIHPDSIEIMIVLKHVHGVVRDVHDAVVIVVPLLHAGRSHSDHLEGHAINADRLAQGRHAREESVPRFRRDDGIESMLHIVGIVEKSSFGNVQVPDRLNRRVEPHYRESE